MATATIEIPDELSELVAQAGDRLPELPAQSLKEPTLPGFASKVTYKPIS
jgi:hypothetical protein